MAIAQQAIDSSFSGNTMCSSINSREEHRSPRNFFRRTSSDKNLSSSTEHSTTGSRGLRRGLPSQGSCRNLLSRASSLRKIHENASNVAGDDDKRSNENKEILPKASKPLRPRVTVDRRLHFRRVQSERALQNNQSDCSRTHSKDSARLFSKVSVTASNAVDEADATDSLLAEMMSSSRTLTAKTDSSSQIGLNDSSQSILMKTSSKRDLFGSSSSVRNLFRSPNHQSPEVKRVSFAQDDEGKTITKRHTYEGPTEEEKHLIYDGRPEAKVFSLLKKEMCSRLIPGSGVFKQAVDSCFEARKTGRRSSLNWGNGDQRHDLDAHEHMVKIIAESNLRGYEDIYSSARCLHREQVIRKIVKAFTSGGGPWRVAKFTSEESARSVKLAHLLALADAQEVERYT